MGKVGKVLSFTVIRSAGLGFSKFSPYVVVLVEFDDKTKLIGQYQGIAEVKIGMKVKAVVRLAIQEDDDSPLVYSIKFVQL